MIAKLNIVEEEADGCLYWLELLVEAGEVPESQAKNLMSEPNEILAMTVASIKTLQGSVGVSLRYTHATGRCFGES